MNNTKSLKIDMKRKGIYKVYTGEPDKSETYPKSNKLAEDDLYQPIEQHGDILYVKYWSIIQIILKCVLSGWVSGGNRA